MHTGFYFNPRLLELLALQQRRDIAARALRLCLLLLLYHPQSLHRDPIGDGGVRKL